MNRERLLKLANYLPSIPDKLWDFACVVREINSCGTVGCALGHCPDIFDEVAFEREPYGFVVMPNDEPKCSFDFASEFFDLTEDEVGYLFYPNAYPIGGPLPANATQQQVSDHLLTFLEQNK